MAIKLDAVGSRHAQVRIDNLDLKANAKLLFGAFLTASSLRIRPVTWRVVANREVFAERSFLEDEIIDRHASALWSQQQHHAGPVHAINDGAAKCGSGITPESLRSERVGELNGTENGTGFFSGPS